MSLKTTITAPAAAVAAALGLLLAAAGQQLWSVGEVSRAGDGPKLSSTRGRAVAPAEEVGPPAPVSLPRVVSAALAQAVEHGPGVDTIVPNLPLGRPATFATSNLQQPEDALIRHRHVVGAETHGHSAEHHVFHPPHSEDVVSVQRAEPDEMYDITILFFYTREFADDFRDRAHMENEIAASVQLLNQALENSRVNARVRTVGIERPSAMPSRQSPAMDWIANNGRAKARRSELGADLVYALVDDPDGYAGLACQPASFRASTGEACFYGSVNNWTPSVRAFDNENIWQTILRHEVGHNLGIQHSPQFGGNPTGGFYPGAVGYTVTSHDPWFGTVMGGNELPRFSTSSERFDFRDHKNLVVGERGVHEASTALLHSIGPVSRYRATVPPTFSTGTTIPDQRWTQGAMIEPLELPAVGGGDGDIGYSLRPELPSGVVFDDSSRILSGRPTAVSGPDEYTYTATDAEGGRASLSFTIEVIEPEPADDTPPCNAAGSGINLDGHQLFMCIVANGEVRQLTAHKLSNRAAFFGSPTDPKAVVKLVRSCRWGAVAAVVTARKFQIRVYNMSNGKEWEYNHNTSGLAPSAYSGNVLCDED